MSTIRPTLHLTPAESLVFLRGLDATGQFRERMATPERAAWLHANGPRRLVAFPVDDAATFLQGLFAVDVAQMLASGPDRPRIRELIKAGRMRYDRKDDDEHWQTYAELLAHAPVPGGDCEDLAAAWAAEMVVDGWDRGSRPVVYRSSSSVSHVVAWSPQNGAYIDPSRLAGMGRE